MLEYTDLKKINSTNTNIDMGFGNTICVTNNRMVVASPSYNNEIDCKVFIFDLDGNQISILLPEVVRDTTTYGMTIAATDKRIYVGNTGTGFTSPSGVVYMYDIDGNLLKIIEPVEKYDNNYFSSFIAAYGDILVVGAPGVGVLGGNSSDNVGAVYMYDIDGNLIKTIQPDYLVSGDYFGTTVDISDSNIIIGSRNKDALSAAGIHITVFDVEGNQISKFTPENYSAYNYYTRAVMLSGDKVILGGTLITGDNADAGIARIYDFNGNMLKEIMSEQPYSNDYFAYSVDTYGEYFVVTEPMRYIDDTHSGSFCLYDRNGDLVDKFINDVPNPADSGVFFGATVGMSNNTLTTLIINYTTGINECKYLNYSNGELNTDKVDYVLGVVIPGGGSRVYKI